MNVVFQDHVIFCHDDQESGQVAKGFSEVSYTDVLKDGPNQGHSDHLAPNILIKTMITITSRDPVKVEVSGSYQTVDKLLQYYLFIPLKVETNLEDI